jgi:hypothetical protein
MTASLLIARKPKLPLRGLLTGTPLRARQGPCACLQVWQLVSPHSTLLQQDLYKSQCLSASRLEVSLASRMLAMGELLICKVGPAPMNSSTFPISILSLAFPSISRLLHGTRFCSVCERPSPPLDFDCKTFTSFQNMSKRSGYSS